MTKREFIDIDNALKAVDDRVEELKKDKQFRYSKQIDVMGVKNHFPEYPILTEQDIVKPYFEKIKSYTDHLRNCGMGKSKSLDFMDKFVDGLIAEQGDTENGNDD